MLQVTRVLTKDSCLLEADLLLAVDGRSLKNRRPARVYAQLDDTGPKGVLLTARGVKLPASAVATVAVGKSCFCLFVCLLIYFCCIVLIFVRQFAFLNSFWSIIRNSWSR